MEKMHPVPIQGQLDPLVLLRHELESHGLELNGDGFVRWANASPHHPRHWSRWRKGYDTLLIIFLDFSTTAISAAGAPASHYARKDFGISETLSIVAFTSMYLLGQALGGMVFPTCSETFGRKKLYLLSSLLYAIACLVIFLLPSLPVVIVGRFMSGFLSATPTIVVAGSIEDLFDIEQRIWIIFAWGVVTYIGMVVGSIVGTFISLSLGWHWIFSLASLVTGILFVLLMFMRESRPSRVLARRLSIFQQTYSSPYPLRMLNPDHTASFRTFVHATLLRPIHLTLSEPIVFLVSFMSAVVSATIYLFMEALPIVYSAYGFTPQQCALAISPIALGLLLGIPLRIHDHHIIRNRHRAGQMLKPEDKLTGFSIAAPVLAISLWWFSWTVPPNGVAVHWIVSMLALALVGFATNEFNCVLAGYIADSYLLFSASAFASLALMRALFSATFPLFARTMYAQLGPNYAGSVLATVATVFCACPLVFICYGERLRTASPFASWSAKMHEENKVGDKVLVDDVEKSRGKECHIDITDAEDRPPVPSKQDIGSSGTPGKRRSGYGAIHVAQSRVLEFRGGDGGRWTSYAEAPATSDGTAGQRYRRSTLDTGRWGPADMELDRWGSYANMRRWRDNAEEGDGSRRDVVTDRRESCGGGIAAWI